MFELLESLGELSSEVGRSRLSTSGLLCLCLAPLKPVNIDVNVLLFSLNMMMLSLADVIRKNLGIETSSDKQYSVTTNRA